MRPDALLLIGPTGAGKSPLGDLFEQRGIKGRRCLHFDFGSRLRTVAGAALPPEGFDTAEHAFIRDVLEKGLLLEDRHFHMAEKIVRHFLAEKAYAAGDMVLLNGLPRHRDQAEDMGRLMHVSGVVVLECSPDIVYARIRLNSGGDRTGRSDDDMDLVRIKLRIFAERTEPLIDHFRSAGATVVRTRVAPHTKAEEMYEEICSSLGAGGQSRDGD